jgi:Ca2+:H+ antiporter
MPSLVSSPIMEANVGYFDESARASRRPSVTLPDILSGDEGDTEADREKRHQTGLPRSHDYQDENNGGASSRSPERKDKKKQKKHKKKRSKKTDTSEPVIEQVEQPQVQQIATDITGISSPRVDFASDVVFREGTPNTRKAFPRPALPKLLSSNVFVDPQPTGLRTLASNHSQTRSNSAPGLRRTNSLPDRLNEEPSIRTTPGAMPLPPFVARSALAARARTESAEIDGEEEDEEEPVMSRTAAVMLLLISTGLVALCAEFLVDAIPSMTSQSAVSQAFIGLIILPIVGNAAEHVTAVTVAAKNKMDLAIGVAVGSSIQIALFVTPLVVILGWCMNKSMSLYFNLFETVSLFATAFVVNFLVLDGRSNYLEGTLLIAAYIIIA